MFDPQAAEKPEIIIGNAENSDLARVIEIDERLTGMRKPEYWQGYLDRALTQPGAVFLVARSEGQPVGFTVGTVRAWEFGSPPTGWVHAILVDMAFRKRGVASRLLSALIEAFRDQEIDTVRTMLHIDNHELISFFRFHGLSAGPYIELEMMLDQSIDPLT